MKSALVTGSSGDIGRSVCRKLAADGWSLYLHYHSNKKVVDDLIYEFTILYPEQDFFPLQVNLEEDYAIERLKKQIFSLNAVIFAHGTTEYGLLKDLTSEKMDTLWKMHVKIPILITQAFQNKLHRDRNGRVVFISSVYGEMGSGNEVFYSTVKGAQLAFVRAYSKEVASWGITVNAISPGAIDTHMNEHYSDNDLEVLKQEIPMRRLGKASEVSFWVSQLLQPESSYMTGQSLTISGGWLK
ncbi:3-oxoacyl-[acyl-carrier-protein] reductase FabG [Jeotgalibaca dankookensis]|uniref:3-oxoacyl-[acyl-carrier-protein] reductase FabG n=1 Tax=Jeotgalibaca dankookensis TaxID=708126 RepID=A0A1S6IN84_9LACT|nr:SDR family oxidoreductase [Jeotgalibaca dankookensis]AQS53013.1 3-oxoacyl-[acyl-carrier-protein] reductase FabG [Jeotgalibaca dankookensis]